MLGVALDRRLKERHRETDLRTVCDTALADIEAQFAERDDAIAVLLPQLRDDKGFSRSNVFCQQLVSLCERYDIPLVLVLHSKTFHEDFDGGLGESDPITDDEVAVLEAQMYQLEKHVILRSAAIYGESDADILAPLLAGLSHEKDLYLSPKPCFSPTHSHEIIRAVVGVLDQISTGAECWGTYHYASSDICSHYEFTEVVLTLSRQYTDGQALEAVLKSDKSASSPWASQVFNCEKILNTFGIHQASWRSAIMSAVQARLTE